jgi:hypothetical protein
MRMNTRRVIAVLCIAILALAGCGKKASPPGEQSPEPGTQPAATALKVTGIEVGKHIGADKLVTLPATTFAPKDTFFVSVATEGTSPSATIAVRWTFGDSTNVIKDMQEPIAPTEPAATEFHIVKQSGWPVGKYRVEVMLDGAPAGSKEFEVKK